MYIKEYRISMTLAAQIGYKLCECRSARCARPVSAACMELEGVSKDVIFRIARRLGFPVKRVCGEWYENNRAVKL